MMGAFGFLWDLLGGWEWLLGLVGGPISIAAVFMRKWKWVALAIGVALVVVAFLLLMLSNERKETKIQTQLGEIRSLARDLETARGNTRTCQSENARNLEQLGEIRAAGAAALAAVSADYERKLRDAHQVARARGKIHDAAKECVGSAGPYRAVLDWVRSTGVPGAADRDEDRADPARAAGAPAELRTRTPAPYRRLERREKRVLGPRRRRRRP